MIRSKINGSSYKIELNSENEFNGSIDNEIFDFLIKSREADSYLIIKDDNKYDIDIISSNVIDKTLKILVNGKEFNVELEDEYDAIVNTLGLVNKPINTNKIVKAHMPGLVLEVHVKVGEEVLKGQKLLTIEAMKMENVIKASENIKIKNVKVIKGNTVEKNDILFELD